MAKDAVATMGNLLPDDAGGRDAVHVAVFSAWSDTRLKPGQHIKVVEQRDNDVRVELCSTDEGVAIVDPFLDRAVLPRERFWAYLYPRTITALSHRWSHPAFEAVDSHNYVPPSAQLASEQWLRDFAQHHDCPSYDVLVNTAILLSKAEGTQQLQVNGDDYLSSYWDNEYWHFSGIDGHAEIPAEFWTHMENVTGIKMKRKPSYFSCSC